MDVQYIARPHPPIHSCILLRLRLIIVTVPRSWRNCSTSWTWTVMATSVLMSLWMSFPATPPPPPLGALRRPPGPLSDHSVPGRFGPRSLLLCKTGGHQLSTPAETASTSSLHSSPVLLGQCNTLEWVAGRFGW